MSFQLDENELAEPESVNVSIVKKESNGKNSEFSRKNSNYQNNNFNNVPNNNPASNKVINEPIQLIDFSRGFQVNPNAIEFLNSIKEDIIVVSVVGKARTGKSYLMNLLLDLIGNKEKYGFKVASSLQSCTKGIWLWGNAKNSLNGNAKIIFLDSEGTSSTDKSTKTYDSRIFALVVLISSLFLYNTYYEIIGMIFMPNVNHYSALAYNINNANLNILNKTIYNDDIENNSEIVFIEFKHFDNLII
jgi:hypothetical protein